MIFRTLGRRFTRLRLAQCVKEEMNTGDDKKLQAILVDYFYLIFLLKGTSEGALFVLFDFGLFAHDPLCLPSKLASSNFDMPVSFIFGKHDWMTAEGCQDVLMSNKYTASGQSQMHVVEKSDHDLSADNPADLARIIIDDLTGAVTHKFDTKLELYYLDDDSVDDQSSPKKRPSQMVIHPYQNITNTSAN